MQRKPELNHRSSFAKLPTVRADLLSYKKFLSCVRSFFRTTSKMLSADLHARYGTKRERKTTEQSARTRSVLDRRSLAFEMGLGVATAAAISLPSLSQAQGAVC